MSYRKPTTRTKGPAKAGTKAKPGASEAKPIKVRKGEKVAVLLSGGNPRIAKAEKLLDRLKRDSIRNGTE